MTHRHIEIIVIVLIIPIFVQVQIEMGISGQTWQEWCKNTATTINDLGDKFCPAFNAAWLAYIKKMYLEDVPRQATTIFNESTMVVDEDYI